MYRLTTYYSFRGLVKIIDLGDVSYGEWVVYDNKEPKYHINSFNKNSASDIIITNLINSEKETIESILRKINAKYGTELSLRHKPLIEIIKKSELVNLDLNPIPESFTKDIY